MKKTIKIIREIGVTVLVLFLVFLIYCMSQGQKISVFGYQVLRVLTSSMEPAIVENTCILIKDVDTDTLKVGDIITFISEDPQIKGFYNTHRIVEIQEENGERVFITKGDHNPKIDDYPSHEESVVGIYVSEIPGGRLLGRMFTALSNNTVYFFVIMLPLFLCMLSYVWQIVKMFTGADDNDEDDDDDEESDEE